MEDSIKKYSQFPNIFNYKNYRNNKPNIYIILLNKEDSVMLGTLSQLENLINKENSVEKGNRPHYILLANDHNQCNQVKKRFK